MQKRRDLITWAGAVVVGAVVGLISGAAGARLGAALTGSVITAVAIVLGRLVWEERAG